jgi:hypothetical protein
VSTEASRRFHYTIRTCWEGIQQDHLIRLEEEAPPCRPAVWFSTRSVWEPTATKGVLLHGRPVLASWDRMQEIGLVRIEVAPETAAHDWEAYKRLADCPWASNLARTGRIAGADPRDWFVSFEPVPSSQWLRVDEWDRNRQLWRELATLAAAAHS